MAERTPRRALEAAALAALALSWLAVRRQLPSAVDVSLYDETQTLGAGWELLHGGRLSLSPAASPLYVVWYGFWHLLAREPLAVYYAQWLATDLLLCFAVYATLRGLGCGLAGGFLGALVWSVLEVTTLGWPRVYFLALLLVLVGLVAELRTGRPFGRLGLILASLVRPEYLAAVGVWVLLAIVRGWPRLPRRARWLGAAVVVVAAAGLLLGGRWGGGRLWNAFSQHYALRYASEHPGTTSDAWLEHTRITGLSFPGAASLAEAARANPREVLRHVSLNILSLPPVLLQALTSMPPLGEWAAALLLPVLLLALAISREWRLPAVDRRGLALLLVAAASIAPTLVVLPKAVYSLPLLLLCVLGLVRGAAAAAGDLLRRLPGPAAALVTPTILVLAPTLLWAVARLPSFPQPTLRTILILREVWRTQPAGTEWRMLEGDGGWCVYLDPGRCRTVYFYDLPSTGRFQDDLVGERINAVLVSVRWSSQARYRTDAAFPRFLREPLPFGFRRVFVTDDAALYLKETRSRDLGR